MKLTLIGGKNRAAKRPIDGAERLREVGLRSGQGVNPHVENHSICIFDDVINLPQAAI